MIRQRLIAGAGAGDPPHADDVEPAAALAEGPPTWTMPIETWLDAGVAEGEQPAAGATAST